jgi:hypothetical protein
MVVLMLLFRMMAQLDYVEDPFARNVDWLLMDLSFIIYVYYLPNNLFKAAPGIAKPPTENQERATGTLESAAS